MTRLSVEQVFGSDHKIVTGRLSKDFNGRKCAAAQRGLTDFGVSFELEGVDGEPLFDLVIVAGDKSIVASAVIEDEVCPTPSQPAPASRSVTRRYSDGVGEPLQ